MADGISVNDWAKAKSPAHARALDFMTGDERKKLRRRLAIDAEIKALQAERAALDPVEAALNAKAEGIEKLMGSVVDERSRTADPVAG